MENSQATLVYKKKGDKSCAYFNRPISLMFVACKVLEKIIINQLRSFLNYNKLLCDN